MVIKLIKSSFFHEKETKEKLCNFIMDAEQLSIWKYCNQFEKDYALWQQRKYCVFFNSWSSANLALIQAMLNMWKLNLGDKVWFSSLTWATNVMPIIQLWLEAVPIDVELNTLNISLETFKKSAQDNNIKCLFITNLLWFCDNIDEIEKYCNENNILLLEDNCESMWTVYKWKKLGNYSFASTFSTFVGHHMSTIEWWMVCTDDKDLYIMLNMVRAHGWDRNLPADIQNEVRKTHGVDASFYSKYTFYTLWYNLRPNEITWFLWCEQVQYLDEIIEKRIKNFEKFVNAVNKNNDFFNLKYSHIEKLSNFAIPVICKSKDILEKYIDIFIKNGIEIRPIVWWDLTQQLFWKNIYWENKIDTNAKLIHEQWFYFWNSPEYTQEEIDLIIQSLK